MATDELTPIELRTILDIGFAFGYSKGYDDGWVDGDEEIPHKPQARKMFENEYSVLLLKLKEASQ